MPDERRPLLGCMLRHICLYWRRQMCRRRGNLGVSQVWKNAASIAKIPVAVWRSLATSSAECSAKRKAKIATAMSVEPPLPLRVLDLCTAGRATACRSDPPGRVDCTSVRRTKSPPSCAYMPRHFYLLLWHGAAETRLGSQTDWENTALIAVVSSRRRKTFSPAPVSTQNYKATL